MASATVGNLRVTLSADSAQFSRGMKSAGKELSTFDRRMGTVMKGLAAFGVAAGAAAAALKVGISRVLGDMDKLSKASQSIGMTTEELSKLRYVAELSGVSFDNLQTSVARLSRAMSETAVGAGGQAAKAFEALGVTVSEADGSLKSASGILGDIAERFAGMEDGAQKTAFAMDIFGRSGAALIPMLNQGRAGMEDLKKEAERLGLVIDGNTARAAERFNDNITRLKRAADGMWNQITTRTIPALENISNAFVNAAKNGKSLEALGDAISWIMTKIAHATLMGAEAVAQFGRVFQAVGAAVSNVTKGEFRAALDEFSKMNADIAEMEEAYRKTIESLYSTQETLGARPLTVPGAGGGGERPNAGNGAMQALSDQLAARYEAFRVSLLSEEELERESYAQRLADLAEFQEAKLISEQDANAARAQITAEHEAKMLELKKQTLTDFQAFQQMSLQEQARTISGYFATIGSQASTILGAMFKDSKAAAIASAVINTAQSITRTLAQYGATPWGLAAAGVAAAAGAAQIASIRSTSQSGSGSVAAPASSVPDPGGTMDRSVYVTLQGQTFGRDQVRDLLGQINEYVADGGQVVLA